MADLKVLQKEITKEVLGLTENGTWCLLCNITIYNGAKIDEITQEVLSKLDTEGVVQLGPNLIHTKGFIAFSIK